LHGQIHLGHTAFAEQCFYVVTGNCLHAQSLLGVIAGV
jgi:hypothetical protein